MVEFRVELRPLTDLSEAILNIRNFVKELINDYSSFTDKKYKNELRSILTQIYFSSDGVLLFLKKYLDSGDRTVLKTLPNELNQSSDSVYDAFSRFRSMSEDLANESIELEDRLKDIFLKKIEPNGIRDSIVGISTIARTDVSEQELREKVETVVLIIQEFNEEVTTLQQRLI